MFTSGQVRDGVSENFCPLEFGQHEDEHKKLKGDLVQGKRLGKKGEFSESCQGYKSFTGT